jgi:uncharacterized caspase-like protein
MITAVPWVAAIWGAVLDGLAPASAWADKRVALVVGNALQTVPKLPNLSRDASSVAKMFRDAGFETVEIQLDVGTEFKRAIRRFETTADQADIADLHAGHGLEIGGINYLILLDAWRASTATLTTRRSAGAAGFPPGRSRHA